MPDGTMTQMIVRKIRRFMGGPEPYVQAAALPWRKTRRGIEVLMVTSRRTGRWVLPKGWPEKRETLYEAAQREAREEAGCEGKIATESLGSFHYEKMMERGIVRTCRVDVFPLRVERELEKFPERRKRDRVWVRPETAATMVAEPELRELLIDFGGQSGEKAA